MVHPPTLARAVAFVCVLTGSASLLGWLFDAPGFADLNPRLASMNPAIAATLVLMGAAFYPIAASSHAVIRSTARALALGIAIAYAVRLWLGYAGLSELPVWFRSVPTASAWIVVALALALVIFEFEIRGVRPAEYLAAGAVLTVALALVSFLHGWFAGMPGRLAPHSLACFTLLGLGVPLARADRGFMAALMSPLSGGVLARRLLPVAFAVPVLIGLLAAAAQRTGDLHPIVALASTVVLSATAFSAVVWWNARYLNRLDASRRESEAALRESELMLSMSQQIAHMGSWEQNLTTRELVWSPETFRILGYESDGKNVSRNRFFERVHPDDRQLVSESFETAMLTRSIYECEHRVVLPDGTVRIVRERAEPRPDARGALRMVGTIQDITDRRHSETQLLEAQKMEAVGRLAGGVAHDFNNLLTVILGHCGLALDSLPEESPLARRIAEIQNEGERASRLTRQLLAFGRRQVMEPRVLNLASVLTGMRQMIRSTVPEHIDTRIVAAERLGHTLLDQGQIEQVILNLVLNARDAMPEGGKLTIELANLELDEARARLHEAPAGRYVMLAVTDTGVGMSEEVRTHIFEPFFTTKPKEKGSGLGLAMVYGIVRQSGGYISCYSEVRAGTTFKILLPRVDSEVEAEAPVAAAGRTTGTETVLLVEDDPAVLELTREVLASAGYTLLSAENPEQAEAQVRQHGGRVELLVTDVILAVGSGREVAQRIAGLQPDVRVLYVSGHTAHAIDHQGMLQPGAWFLQKPFTPRDLLLRVRQVLDLERPVAE